MDKTNLMARDVYLRVGILSMGPWAGALLEGRKTIEGRAYDLPPTLFGQLITII
jgi:hypothetical protein